jgi:hypothetical protein
MAKRAALRLALLALLASGCAAGRTPSEPIRPPLRRVGAERTLLPYDDPRAPAKRVLLEQINRDREREGVAPVAYEQRAALVGDQFCLDAALAATTGHWDQAGRAPYIRWGLAGGIDYHAQNVAAISFGSGAVLKPLEELLLASQAEMMAEEPPRDGHRRTILDPHSTHVGIGVAVVAGEFRMSQEFTRVALEWLELPDGPLPVGGTAHVAGRPLPGLHLGLVEVLHEPPPRPLTLLEVRARLGSYAYPPVVRSLRRAPDPAFAYADGSRGDVKVDGSRRFSFAFRLDRGPGHYLVICYVTPRLTGGEPLWPATAAVVTALS